MSPQHNADVLLRRLASKAAGRVEASSMSNSSPHLKRSSFLSVGVSLVALLSACGGPQGPHVRFARTNAAEIAAARATGDVIWYDFAQGDEVPLALGVLGVMEAVTEPPIRMVAKREFSIVVFPDGHTMFSFDGQSLEPPTAARWAIGLEAENNQPGATIVMFVGHESDMPAATR